MTTTTQLAALRKRGHFSQPGNSSKADARELWADGLAAAAAVTLFSSLVFEVLRMLI